MIRWIKVKTITENVEPVQRNALVLFDGFSGSSDAANPNGDQIEWVPGTDNERLEWRTAVRDCRKEITAALNEYNARRRSLGRLAFRLGGEKVSRCGPGGWTCPAIPLLERCVGAGAAAAPVPIPARTPVSGTTPEGRTTPVDRTSGSSSTRPATIPVAGAAGTPAGIPAGIPAATRVAVTPVPTADIRAADIRAAAIPATAVGMARIPVGTTAAVTGPPMEEEGTESASRSRQGDLQ